MYQLRDTCYKKAGRSKEERRSAVDNLVFVAFVRWRAFEKVVSGRRRKDVSMDRVLFGFNELFFPDGGGGEEGRVGCV